ncbi:MAG: hypothetical protein LBS99_02770 [Clostridiales bacterium]|jgi:hypothetical protein|nr:hypothetical protein [Clostridiales bacterium]
MKLKRLTVALTAFLVAFGTVGCTTPPKGENDVLLLLQGWTNTPTDSQDPYKKYISDSFGLNVSLNASSDFDNACVVAFQSSNRPDIVSFPDYTTFQKYFKQSVLIDDWTPYLQYMPNFSSVIDSAQQASAKQIFSAGGKLSALWTPAEPPVWSLKIREDWLTQFRAEKSYAAAWAPTTPDMLLEFARWIKTAKNPNQAALDVFAFTSAGGSNSLGVLGTWLPLMYGAVSVAPFGFYPEGDEVKFSTTDGSYKQMLEFLRTVVQEQLIEPTWYSQQFADKHRTYQGKIAIEWLPGSVTDYTQAEFTDADGNVTQDTTDWWETYDLPVQPGTANTRAGNMPGPGLAGKIITVSKKAALNADKMRKICALIDACYSRYDAETDTYARGSAYDALRWGVGIEDGLAYADIAGANLKYINTSSVSAGRGERYYREKQTGAWDWGAWFSSTNDGIIQGNKSEVDAIVLKVAQHNVKTANMAAKPEIGAYLQFPAADLNEMVNEMVAFEYGYATQSGWDSSERETRYNAFIQRWRTSLKGNDFLASAAEQFRSLGLF